MAAQATSTTAAGAPTATLPQAATTATDPNQPAAQPEGGGGAATTDATTTPASTRLSKTTAHLPIVYGSVANYLGKKADEFQTHEWTLYVRGPNHEDLSVVISKVVFQLHASFAQPVRELARPPFQVTERGWGEFEAQIRIIWKDASEKPTVVGLLCRSCVSFAWCLSLDSVNSTYSSTSVPGQSWY